MTSILSNEKVSMNEELKHCPFCGSEGKRLQKEDKGPYYSYVRCRNCQVSTEKDSLKNCIEIWNKRTTDKLLDEALKEIDKQILEHQKFKKEGIGLVVEDYTDYLKMIQSILRGEGKEMQCDQ
jgi:Lar family restriction alleviation protein